MAEVYELPNGKRLHRSTDVDGQMWACIASDHGPFCRRCQKVDEIADACLQHVIDGLMDVSDDPETGEFLFRITGEGLRRADQILGRSQ